MAHDDDLLPIEEAADYLSLSVARLRNMRRDHEGPISWREGKRLVYPRSGLDQYKDRRRLATLRGDGVGQ